MRCSLFVLPSVLLKQTTLIRVRGGGFLALGFGGDGRRFRFVFLRHRQVTDTIELPIFWVPWLMAAAFGLSAVIVTFHLLHPGREMIRP